MRRMSALRQSGLAIALSVAILAVAAISSAQAMKIQKVVSEKGIEAWLVEDHNLPLLSMQFAFKGGSSQDPAGKAGTSYFVSSMLDEGAGDLTSQAFQQRMEEIAMRLDFDTSADHMTGSFQTLTKNRSEALNLLKLALTKPRFEEGDAERIRGQITSLIRFDAMDPDKVASQEWFKLAFQGHPYGSPNRGTLESVQAITVDDLRAFTEKTLARDNLKIAVVGDITAAELKTALDEVFGALPEKAKLTPVSEVNWPEGYLRKIVEMPNPQSVAQFGFKGLKRNDPDFIPGYILNYIIGGGGFASKLMQEVREKRGLAYSVYTYLYPLDHTGIFAGGVATENKEVGQSLSVIKAELERIAAQGPTEEELRNAKDYLIGSFALRFDTSTKIAAQLLAIQLDNLGIDYLDKRNDLIEAVTMDDMRRVAQRMLGAQNLIVTIVGQPDGLENVGVTN